MNGFYNEQPQINMPIQSDGKEITDNQETANEGARYLKSVIDKEEINQSAVRKTLWKIKRARDTFTERTLQSTFYYK